MNYIWFWFILFTFISLRDILLNSDLGKITWQSFIWCLFYIFSHKIRLIWYLNLLFKNDLFFFTVSFQSAFCSFIWYFLSLELFAHLFNSNFQVHISVFLFHKCNFAHSFKKVSTFQYIEIVTQQSFTLYTSM